MMRRVGPKGQVVIEKEIRDRLGVQPGSVAIQKLVGDHVEIRFAPPPAKVVLHDRSLLGILGSPSSTDASGVTPPPEEWGRARAKAWADAAREEEQKWRASRHKANGAPR